MREPAEFVDRAHAGRVLAQLLAHHAGRADTIVFGLPRGGVPVAYEVALALGAPLDVFVVRKLGVPGHRELAFGALASGGVRVLNHDIVRELGLGEQTIESVIAAEQEELERRERAYRGDAPPPPVAGRTAILIDDGLATGATMRAAVAALRSRRAATIVVAVPTAAAQTCALLASEVDELVCALTPEPFVAVGRWYRDFSQVTDEQVRDLLRLAAARRAP